jgi:hypothetical protein
MQGELHPRNNESFSQNICIASLLIILYNGTDITFVSQNLTQSLFWIVRPFAWAVLFSGFAKIISQIDFTTAISNSVMAHVRLGVSRFVPPFVVAVAIPALVMGPLASSTPLRLYFRDRAFWGYWLNLVGVPRFTLPGVFQNSIVPQTINANLWAIPFFVGLCLLALGAACRPRLLRPLSLLLGVAVLLIEFLASSRGLRIFETAGLVRGEGVGLPATALLAGLLTTGLAGTRLAGFCARIPWVLVLLYGASLGALLPRGELETPIATLAIAIGGALIVLPDRRASPSLRLATPLLPIFFLLSYPLQQLIETGLRDSVNGFVLIVAPIPALILLTLMLSRPLARLVKDDTEILAAWDLSLLSTGRGGGGISGRRKLALILPLIGISIVMILLFLALTLALTPPKVTT